ncbi:MAG: GIY-YIG nuclease family protein [Solobacterium sp.]|nr:GIY-YIG nuclease family protein [Solobacterium sp.]
MKRFFSLLFKTGMVLLGAGSFLMCSSMLRKEPVPYPWVWIIGLIAALLYTSLKLSGMNVSERYTMKEFESRWIEDRAKQKGLLYRDKPGCYVILIYGPLSLKPSGVYAGQSLEVYRRVHNHLNRKGNGDVYADARDGKRIVIEVYPCPPSGLNDLERKLIRKYHAEAYYNRTAGGGAKRSFFDR